MLYFSEVVSTFSKESLCQSYNGITQVQHKICSFEDNLLSSSITNNTVEGIKSSSLTLILQR